MGAAGHTGARVVQEKPSASTRVDRKIAGSKGPDVGQPGPGSPGATTTMGMPQVS